MAETVERLVVVGVGLIGGSIALGARQRAAAREVVGVVRSEASGRRAIEAGVVEQVSTELAAAVRDADLVIVCTPVADVAPTILAAAEHCQSTALLTDAGSTKGGIVDAVEAGLRSFADPPAFVGSHPLAGDHRTGPESARGDLLEGNAVVVTPTGGPAVAAADRIEGFWRSLGAEPIRMTPDEHDAALAQTSHVPHVLAAALAAATSAEALPLAASGWRDTTRVAAGSPSLWRDILMANRESVLAALAGVEGAISEYREALSAGDPNAIEQLLEQGKERRDAVGD